ncbi:hypothetical protein ZIOFF_009263 [Zingiber officinale]|uniref:RNA helicase n=1 Tax=Zingiber officinale TaxID=94328 RepID=A0A8J5HFC3_ZINOF|nr:hypothetical protein ZIOFF_009263 [Zingiber officinale]
MEDYSSWQPFIVVLYCSTHGVCEDMCFSDVHELMSSIPSCTVFHCIYSSDPVFGRLFFNIYGGSLDAILFLWGHRLDGAHLLTPLIEVSFDAPYDKSKEEILLKALFCSHIRGLLYYIGVQFLEQKISELSMKINNISARHTTLMRFTDFHHQHHQMEDYLSWPPFIVVLYCSTHGVREDMCFSDVHEFIFSIPSCTVFQYIYSSDPVFGRLFFDIYGDALNAILFLWGRRLDGAHLLTPLIKVTFDAPYDKSEFTDFHHQHHQMEDYLSWPPFVVVLYFSTHGVREDMCFSDVHELIFSIPSCTVFQYTYSSGPIFGRLFFDIYGDALNAILFLWGRRLDGTHLLTPLIEVTFDAPYDKSEISGTFMLSEVVVLIGETGSGKSTQLTQYIADSGFAARKAVVCTQPRKIETNTLAQRVREEANGCYPNNFVRSYPSDSPFQEFKSGIIFLTDHCFLQHFMNGTSWEGVSCIIIDEAHERSLNTDLLLALIKKELLKRPELHVIIISATADATKFSYYFYGCSTYYVMGRNFPVEIKYVADVSASPYDSTNIKVPSEKCASYVLDVLKMVSYIHKTEEDGAILAFLTSQIEVEWACEIFTDPTALVMPMHGKLSVEEQRKVFQVYPGKRKVIFCTNIAETSLTIKDIKYIVDSGMVKESRFEPSTGTNVLKVSPVRQSSANQRAGRAGRTEPGKCYRLYSESDFHATKMHQEPEIRKFHLGIAALRILALGIKNVDDFEFVDAPCPRAVEIAIQNLIHLGAVTRKGEVFDLTEIGQYLVKLGIEPLLVKIILDCFDCGLRKEGVVLAVVMANASSIFCRVGTEENKHKADYLRVQFCHHDGDLFSLLSVYRTWEAERESRNWYWQNSINAKSMRRCKEAISELESCIQHELNIIIPSYWLWNPDIPNAYDKSLKKVILFSLSENVAMFSGRDQLGYEVAITDSSSLVLFGSGAEIKHLELEGRFLSVEILHSNSLALDDKELLMMADNCVCRIANYHKYVGTRQEGADETKWGRITFLSPDMAEYAIKKLNLLEFGGSILKALPIRTADQKMKPFSGVRVKLCWPRKPSKGIALVTCAPGEAEYVVEDCFSLAIGGGYIDPQVSEKFKNCVFVKGIPIDVLEDELYDAFQSLAKRKIFNIHLLRREVITDLSTSTFEEALIKEISPFMHNKHFSDNSFRVEIFRPAPQDSITRAMITFDGSLHLEAAKALEHIQGKSAAWLSLMQNFPSKS